MQEQDCLADHKCCDMGLHAVLMLVGTFQNWLCVCMVSTAISLVRHVFSCTSFLPRLNIVFKLIILDLYRKSLFPGSH